MENRGRFASGLVGLLVFLLLVQSAAWASPAVRPLAGAPAYAWPMSQSDAGHTSSSSYPGPTNGLVRWVFGVSDQFDSAPLVGGNGTVYALSGSVLYALRGDGSVVWAREVDGAAGSPALGPGGMVYVPQLHSVAAFTSGGSLAWNTTLGSPNVGTSLTVGPDGQVYSADVSTLYSVTSSGAQDWSLPVGCGLSSASIGPDGTVYCGGRDGNAGVLYAIDPRGAVLWKFSTAAPVVSSPMVGTNGTIYVADSSGTLYALNQAGAPAGIGWNKGITMGFLIHAMALGGSGKVFVGGTHLRVLDGTGAVLSDATCYNNPAKGICVPFGKIGGISVDAGGELFLESASGNSSSVVALGSNGSSLWTYQPPSGEFVSGDAALGATGTLYFGTSCAPCTGGRSAGHLYAVGTPAGLAPVTVQQSTLPLGQAWNVTVRGEAFLANQQGMQFALPGGASYAWEAPVVYATQPGTRFVPQTGSGSLSVGASGSLEVRYTTEYEVQFGVFPFGGGNATNAGGWFAQSDTVTIASVPTPGYEFGYWSSGSSLLAPVSPASADTSLVVGGPGTVVATFYPRVTISAGSGGSLTAIYGDTRTLVPSGRSVDVYLPVSTRVVITAAPSQNYALLGWTSTPLTTGFGNLSVIVFPVPSVPSQVAAAFGALATTTVTTVKTTTTTAQSTTQTTSTSTTTKGGGLGLHLTWYEVGAGVVVVIIAGAAFLWYRRRSAARRRVELT